jgi:ABC-2 type transport system permease protein
MSIRDQGYTRYEGDLTAGAPAFWVIATQGLSHYWGFLRTKLLFIVMLIVPVLFSIATFAEQAVRKMFGGAGAEQVSGFFEYAFGVSEIWMVALVFAASGCGVIAEDMRYRTIQLYFSKPITRMDYVAGKFLSLVMLGSLVSLLPYLLVGTLRALIFIPKPFFTDALKNIALLGVFNLVLLVVFSAMVMALSCLTRRTGFVVLMWLGSLLIPSMVSTGVGLARKGEAWTDLISIAASLSTTLKVMVGYTGMQAPGELAAPELPEYMTWAPWAVLVAVLVAAGSVIYWRTSKLEGIA